MNATIAANTTTPDPQTTPLGEPAVQNTTALPEPYAIRIPAALRYSGLSNSGLYRRIAAGKIDVIKDGKTTLIVFASLKRYMADLPRIETVPKRHVGAKAA